MKGFVDDIEDRTEENSDFRMVLYTGHQMQLVLMSIEPGEEIGEEVHDDGDQFFRIEEGEGEVVIDGHRSKVKGAHFRPSGGCDRSGVPAASPSRWVYRLRALGGPRPVGRARSNVHTSKRLSLWHEMQSSRSSTTATMRPMRRVISTGCPNPMR